jgi:hypothetical protein
LEITSASPLPARQINADYAFDFAATGGVPPYTWDDPQPGSHPGFTLAANGHFTGNDGGNGTEFQFPIGVTDANSTRVEKSFAFPAAGPPSSSSSSSSEAP